MKDYAVQQRRLHHEIITYMDRNQREAESKAAEEAEQKSIPSEPVEHKESPAADESGGDADAVPAIPPEKVERPTLLFSHDTPQQTLESPHDFQQFSHEDIPVSSSAQQSLTLHLSLPTVTKGILNSPPGELLLSPQYVPQLTAKKIFSVSKVSETSVSSGAAVSPLDTAGSAGVEASDLCQKMADETIKEYIDQIVTAEDGDDGEEKEHVPDADRICDTGATTYDASSTRMELLNAEVNPITDAVSDPVHHEATVRPDSGADSLKLSTTDAEINLENGNGRKEISSKSNISPSLCTVLEGEPNTISVMGFDNNVEHDSSTDIENNGSSEMNTNELLVEEVKKNDGIGNVSGEIVSETDRDSSVIPSETMTNSQEHTKGVISLANSTPQTTDSPAQSTKSPAQNTDSPTQSTNSTKRNSRTDSGIGSYENEQWLKVDSSDLSQQVCSPQEFMENQQTEKPNFHSNLSVNGLARELASVLDALDDQSETSFAGGKLKKSANINCFNIFIFIFFQLF